MLTDGRTDRRQTIPGDNSSAELKLKAELKKLIFEILEINLRIKDPPITVWGEWLGYLYTIQHHMPHTLTL